MSLEALKCFFDADLSGRSKEIREQVEKDMLELFSDEVCANKTSIERLEYLFQLREGENGVIYSCRKYFQKTTNPKKGSSLNIDAQQACMMVCHLKYPHKFDPKNSPFYAEDPKVKPLTETSLEAGIKAFRESFGDQWDRVGICALAEWN